LSSKAIWQRDSFGIVKGVQHFLRDLHRSGGGRVRLQDVELTIRQAAAFFRFYFGDDQPFGVPFTQALAQVVVFVFVWLAGRE
jgi:hypothetical protein